MSKPLALELTGGKKMVTIQDIYAARKRIAPLVSRTPLEYNRP